MASVRELFDLSGRVSVVTGGTAGLGLQMATALAEAGSSVVICSRKKENCDAAAQQLAKVGTPVLAVACDVSRHEEIEALKDQVLNRFGQVDVLVNNAGRTWWASPEDIPLDRWQYVMDLNITGTFLCSQVEIAIGSNSAKSISWRRSLSVSRGAGRPKRPGRVPCF